MDTPSPVPPRPMPMRLWELILVQLSFAVFAGILIAHWSWTSELSRGAMWVVSLLGAARACATPLAIEDFVLGARARWNVWGRTALILVCAGEIARLPLMGLLGRKTLAIDMFVAWATLVAGIAALATHGADGRRRWRSLWGWVPAGLLAVHPAIVAIAWRAVRF